jgi:hypothetical protein
MNPSNGSSSALSRDQAASSVSELPLQPPPPGVPFGGIVLVHVQIHAQNGLVLEVAIKLDEALVGQHGRISDGCPPPFRPAAEVEKVDARIDSPLARLGSPLSRALTAVGLASSFHRLHGRRGQHPERIPSSGFLT